MTPPDAHITGSDDPSGCARPAAPLLGLGMLTKRADFVALARARRAHAAGFVLQARVRPADHPDHPPCRIGYTCSKKVGNAVARNRAKRRLREVARQILPQHGQPGWDYVLIGRKDATATLPFAQLLEDLHVALARVHGA